MEIAVKETYARILKNESLVQNAKTLYIVELPFDKSWDGYTKTATFKADSVGLSVKLTDDRCIIPAERLEQAGVSLRIGVSGVKGGERGGTVWCLTSRIVYAVGTAQLIPPSHSGADIRAQILKVIRKDTATDEEVDMALNDTFTPGWTFPDNPEHPGNTITDEEVKDVLDDAFGDEP